MANVSEYLRNLDKVQELNIDEGEKRCGSSLEVCYGKITIIAVNMTVEGDSKQHEGYEV